MLLSYLYFCLKFVFTLIKLLKRREIFVILSKLCVFFLIHICIYIYIYKYIYILYILYQILEKGHTLDLL